MISPTIIDLLETNNRFSKYTFNKFTERAIGDNSQVDSTPQVDSIPAVISTPQVDSTLTVDSTPAVENNTPMDLKPVKSYKLSDLQKIATQNNINIKKNGKQSTLINKSKQELYDDINRL